MPIFSKPETSLAPKLSITGSTPIFGDRKIHFHLGAHKTATTYIQRNLNVNKAALLKEGVLYFPTEKNRLNGLSKAIVALCQSTRTSDSLVGLRKKIIEACDPIALEQCHTILFSEENFSATPASLSKGSGYSKMGDKLKFLRDEFGPNLHVFFSIRDYPGFLSSLYVESLRRNAYCSWDNYLNEVYQEMPTLWLEAYNILSGLFGVDNVTFWDFRETVARPQEILSMLTGASLAFKVNSAPVRESLSQRAIEFIRDFYNLPGTPFPPDLIPKVANRLYPLAKVNGKFDPWSSKERAALQSHYVSELKSIPLKKFTSNG